MLPQRPNADPLRLHIVASNMLRKVGVTLRPSRAVEVIVRRTKVPRLVAQVRKMWC